MKLKRNKKTNKQKKLKWIFILEKWIDKTKLKK